MANNDVGLYQFRSMLIKTLLEQGNEVYISDPDGECIPLLIKMGCKFINTSIDRRGINPKTDLKLFVHYMKILNQVKPDQVITYTIKPNIYGGLACRLKRVPYAVNITGLGTTFQNAGLLKKLVIFLYKLADRKVKVMFFENSANMEMFQVLKIISPEKCKLLSGAGVDLDHFRYMSYPVEETTHFLFIGRVMKEKGIDELFEAMERLRSDGENCVLDVLGDFEEHYESQIQKYTEAGWLNYYGYQQDIRSYIEKAHCFVLPSWHEGMANTNLENAACGRPVITSNIPGCKEAVLEGKSGLLCESQNTDSLYGVMKIFLTMPFKNRLAMGRAGRKHMEDMFDKRKVVLETIKGLE
ncbi:glycosyltransferase family 4 protein [Murimonas intestini]|nr:glycosyltransferase family 4 protein [Murimonas intestini]